MHYIAVFLFFILTALNSLKCSFFEIEFEDNATISAPLFSDNGMLLKGKTDSTIITFENFYIIEAPNSSYPLSDIIIEARLERGMVKDANGIVKIAPAVFSLLYSESRNYRITVESQANQLANRFREGKHFTREEYALGMLIYRLIPNASTETFQQYFSPERAQAIYATFMQSSFRPGSDFTLKEQERALKILRKHNDSTYLNALEKKFSQARALALYQNWTHRPGTDFTDTEFDKAIQILHETHYKTEEDYLTALQQKFSQVRTLALYQNWPHRPGANFTDTEFTKSISLLQNSIDTTEEHCLQILQQAFSPDRALALYQNWPYRPGAEFTDTEFNKTINLLRSLWRPTKADCLKRLQENFSKMRALALYQNWPQRPGADFTDTEFDRAMAMILAAENKTTKGYLEILSKEFPRARALALYQNWTHRPGTDFTNEEFDKAIQILYETHDKTEEGYSNALKQKFSQARALALYRNWPHRPGADFTDTEFDKTMELLKNVSEKTETACLAKLQEYFADERALALFINRPDRPGADFTKFELSKTTWLLQKATSQNEQGYLNALQTVFSFERAQALLNAFVSGDLIVPKTQEEKVADEIHCKFRGEELYKGG